jgi:hypothetical protein
VEFLTQPQNRSAYRIIERQDLLGLHFADGDVHSREELRQARWMLLHKATFEGNIEERKVTLYFTAVEGGFALHTTLWACTEDKVVFKNGEELPIRAIDAVEFHHSSEEE